MVPFQAEARNGVAWMQVLDHIQAKIDAALADDGKADIPAFPANSDRISFQELDDRLARFHASLEQAEANAARIDASLQTEAEATQRHLDNLGQMGRKLADWTTRAI
jgi:hypothetical protein